MRGAHLSLLATLLLAGCFAPAYENGRLRCAEGECPEGYYCAMGSRCWRHGTVPELDGDGGTMQPPGDAAVNDGPPPLDGPNLEPVDGDLDHALPSPGDVIEEPETGADPQARLLSLEVTPGSLRPAFTPGLFQYELDLPLFTRSISVKATAENVASMLLFNGTTYPGPTFSATLPLLFGVTRSDVTVLIPGGMGRYRVFVSTGGTVSYFKPPNTHVGMAFGRSVALSGTTLVVGAPDDKGMGTGPQTGEIPLGPIEVGAAFVYSRGPGSPWRRDVALKPLVVQPRMRFGAAIAVAGDTMVVGAPDESGSARVINGVPDVKADKAGAAYVFVHTGEGWTQQAYLKAADAAGGDQFGSSVALFTSMGAGGMAVTTIAVGAPGAAGPGNAARAGAVYVFVRTGLTGTWSQQASPDASNAKGANEFGASVALAGDTLVVGAPLEDGAASGVNPGSTSATQADSGAAYVFNRNGTSWAQSAYIKAPAAATYVNFGTRVAIAGQYLAVSAPRDGVGARGIDFVPGALPLPGSGAVHLYLRNGNSWTHLHNIKASNAHASDLFGQALALSATTLVVGAPLEDTNGAGAIDPGPMNAALDSGAVYVFQPTDGHWSELIRLKAPNAEGADNFGNAVATDGESVVAGAEGEASSARSIDGNQNDNTAPGSGAVYVY